MERGIWPEVISGHNPEKEPEWFRDYEPIHNVSPSYPPTMLLHGKMDTESSFKQAVEMAEALKRNNVDHELVVRHDWVHCFDTEGFDKPSVKEAYRRVVAFLCKHVKKQSANGVVR